MKITITLNTQSVDFFKGYAAKHKMKYQTVINEALNEYAQKNKNKINV